ncbi:MAG: hypothetical protein WC567_03835 [Kiritimatiellia bacterium]|jgi:hypothetical protein
MNLLDNLNRAKSQLSNVDNSTCHVISSAHQAFGGHVSRGLLKRARNAANRRALASNKVSRTEIFYKLSQYPNLDGYTVTSDQWNEISELIYKMTIWAELGDKFDYRSASMTNMLWDKKQAIIHFVKRYAGKRTQKELEKVIKID